MPDIPLREYAAGKTQTDAAQAIGVTQSGLSQMLRSAREIYVRLDDSGRVLGAYEIRWISSRKVSKR